MHPQARAFLDGPVRAQRFPPSEELQDPERLHGYLNSIRGHVELPESPIPVSQVDQETAFTVPVRVYHGDAPSAVIVYMHGGGWVAGDLNTHDAVCRYLARHTPAVVVNVDYRLAPETPYPGPLDDTFSALCWSAERAADWGVTSGRLVVAGSSSGGNLAAAAALHARDTGWPALAGQILIYPVTDHVTDTESYRLFGDGDHYLSAVQMDWYWQQYVPDQAQRLSPDASPIHASSLAGLAPAMLITAGRDILCAESEEYARRLAEAGVPARLRNYPHASHGFFHLLGAAPDARDAVDTSAKAVRRVLGRDPADRPGDPLRPAEIRTADKRHL